MAVPRLQARLGPGRALGRHAAGAARAGLRARLHLPQPGRLGQAPVPVHARPVLVPVLHVDGGRQALEPAADARARAARLRPQRAPLREVRRGAGRLDPDDVLRRPPGLVQEQPLLHALQGRPLLQGGRERHRAGRATCRSGSSQLDVVQRYSAAKRPRRGRWTSPGARTACRRSSTRAASATTTSSGTRAGTARRWATRLVSPAGGSAVRLPQRRHHVQPRGPALGRAHAADRRAARDRGAPHGRSGAHVGAVPAHARVEGAQLPPGVPARDRRPGPARGRLRVGRGQELPQLPHGREHADRQGAPARAAAAARADADADGDADAPRRTASSVRARGT